MEELVAQWGFKPKVADELRRCGIVSERDLLSIDKEDFDYMTADIPPNILNRLCRKVVESKEFNKFMPDTDNSPKKIINSGSDEDSFSDEQEEKLLSRKLVVFNKSTESSDNSESSPDASPHSSENFDIEQNQSVESPDHLSFCDNYQNFTDDDSIEENNNRYGESVSEKYQYFDELKSTKLNLNKSVNKINKRKICAQDTDFNQASKKSKVTEDDGTHIFQVSKKDCAEKIDKTNEVYNNTESSLANLKHKSFVDSKTNKEFNSKHAKRKNDSGISSLCQVPLKKPRIIDDKILVPGSTTKLISENDSIRVFSVSKKRKPSEYFAPKNSNFRLGNEPHNSVKSCRAEENSQIVNRVDETIETLSSQNARIDDILGVDLFAKPHQKFNTTFRLNKENLCVEAVRTVLKDSNEGLGILKNYEKHEILKPHERDDLVALIINRCDPNLQCHVNQFMEKLAKIIQTLMKNEIVSIYYIGPKTNGNESKNAKGKLPDKWRNHTDRLRKSGVLPKKIKVIDNYEKEADDDDDSNISALNDEVKAKINWLKKYQNKPWDKIKEFWVSTYDFRAKTLSKNTYEDIFNKNWPLLNSVYAPQLLDIDFSKKYPHTELCIQKNWVAVFDVIYRTRVEYIRDLKGKFLVSQYDEGQSMESNVNLDGTRIMLLPYLLPLAGKIKTGDGMKKVSIQESSEGYALWCKSISDVAVALKQRSDRYVKWKLKVQPVIILVGENLVDLETCYVSIDKYMWEVEEPTSALDTAFKFIMLMNIAYPEDCKHIWMVLQECVYGIKIGSKSTPTISTQAINAVNVHLKTKTKNTKN